MWIGFCAFHMGDYKKAMQVYENVMNKPTKPSEVATFLACCYFFLGMYPEADKVL
jgi:intraflagellar transport protein 56